MDKKGPAYYLRLPLSLEAEIERMANEEGRSKCDMMMILIALGCHVKRFHIRDVTTSHDWGEGNKR